MFKGFGVFRRELLAKREKEQQEKAAQEAHRAAVDARLAKTWPFPESFERELAFRSSTGTAYRYLLAEIAYLRARVEILEQR